MSLIWLLFNLIYVLLTWHIFFRCILLYDVLHQSVLKRFPALFNLKKQNKITIEIMSLRSLSVLSGRGQIFLSLLFTAVLAGVAIKSLMSFDLIRGWF